MTIYSIIETDDGLMIVDHPDNVTVEEAAVRHGGVVVDGGPYENRDEAYDALLALQRDSEEEEEAGMQT